MIAKMHKLYIAARKDDHQRLLQRLGQLHLVHFWAVDPAAAVADEKTITALEHLRLALQKLASVTAIGEAPEISPLDGAAEVMRIQRESAEFTSRLAGLHQQIEQLGMWGDVKLETFAQLHEKGIDVEFFAIPAEQIPQIQGECVQVFSTLPDKRVMVALIDRQKASVVPEEAESIPLPARDRPSIRTEAAEINQKLKQNNQRLSELAHITAAMQEKLTELQSQAQFTIAVKGGLTAENLFALQGWVPADESEKLPELLSQAGIEAAVEVIEPEEDERPPTLIRYPKWAMPIKGLFDILNTFPGYHEIDLSSFFMVALPLFAAMLIGDAGYGIVFLLPGLLLYRKAKAAGATEKIQLLIVVGAMTLVWGILTANYFGVTPESMATVGGYVKSVNGSEIADYQSMHSGTGPWAAIGNTMIALAPLWRETGDAAREVLIKLSFIFGCLHLILAHLRQSIAYWPDKRALAQLGWCMVLAAMLGVIWILFFGAAPIDQSVIVGALLVGLVMVIMFSVPSRNPLKRIGFGFAASLLPFIGTFSDTMSYIRLMAVGLASYYIAVAFNSLAASLAGAATWFAAAPVLVFGHSLNMALAVIAIFAHGVRLNMLEFSNNAGVQWAGYAYAPFAPGNVKEVA